MKADDIYQIIMNSYDKKQKRYKLIIWIGAGIDHDEPTGLPLGNDLTEFMIINSMPDHLLNRYQRCRKATQKKKMLAKIYGSLRLETVIEAYRILENSILDHHLSHPFLSGFKSFENRMPNDIHFTLARLLKDGANIVSANYDNCINSAYYQLTGDQLQCQRDNSSPFHKGFYTYYSLYPQTGKIYHFHGVAHDIESLGASLTQLCNGLSLSFQQQIRTWIENDYTFLFLGYSGGDALDVNPVFQGFTGEPGKTAVFLRYHPLHENTIAPEAMTRYEKILLNPFVHKIVFEGNISKILNIKTTAASPIDNQGWQECFFENAHKLNADMRLLVTIILCCLLGMTNKKLLPAKWWIKAAACQEVEPWLINYYGHELANIMNNDKVARCFDFYDQSSPLEQSNTAASHHDIEKAVAVFGDMQKIYRELKTIAGSDTRKIDWNISTPLNRMTDVLVEKNQAEPKDVDALLESLYLTVLNRHQIVDILQYITALRGYGILLVKYKRNAEGINYIKESLELYKEINSHKGMIKTLFFLKQCYHPSLSDMSYSVLMKKRININIQIFSLIIACRQFQYGKKMIIQTVLKYFRFLKGR